MAINFGQGFNITSSEPVDARILKSKAEMANMTSIQELRMPDKYFAICKDDGQLYLFDKANDKDPETGRFRLYEPEVLVNAYDSISRVSEYLYETEYSNLDYEYANNWFKNSNEDLIGGACSSTRRGN